MSVYAYCELEKHRLLFWLCTVCAKLNLFREFHNLLISLRDDEKYLKHVWILSKLLSLPKHG
jgi:hypothetical protein